MFIQELKYILIKPTELSIGKDDKFADPAFIAICIIFLQNLISVQSIDSNQLDALILFSIAIPMLVVHFIIIQTLDPPNLPLPAFVAKSFYYASNIGELCTILGILIMIYRVSEIASEIFLASCIVGVAVLALVRTKSRAMKKEAEKQKLQ